MRKSLLSIVAVFGLTVNSFGGAYDSEVGLYNVLFGDGDAKVFKQESKQAIATFNKLDSKGKAREVKNKLGSIVSNAMFKALYNPRLTDEEQDEMREFITANYGVSFEWEDHEIDEEFAKKNEGELMFLYNEFNNLNYMIDINKQGK